MQTIIEKGLINSKKYAEIIKLYKKLNSELTIWFLTHNRLQFDIWNIQSLINAALVIKKVHDLQTRPRNFRNSENMPKNTLRVESFTGQKFRRYKLSWVKIFVNAIVKIKFRGDLLCEWWGKEI